MGMARAEYYGEEAPGILDREQGKEELVMTRSLMLAELQPEESIRLQEDGLGPLRHMGCGIFIPHKGIEAVKKTVDDGFTLGQ